VAGKHGCARGAGGEFRGTSSGSCIHDILYMHDTHVHVYIHIYIHTYIDICIYTYSINIHTKSHGHV